MKTIYFAIVAVLATAVSVAANSTLVTSGIVPVGFLVGPPPTGGLQSTAGSYNLVVPKYNGPNILIGVSYTLDVYTYAQYDVAHSDRSGHLFRFDSDSETENVGQGSDFGRTVSRSEATLWVVSLSA